MNELLCKFIYINLRQCAASSILALSTRDRPLRSRKYGDTLVWYQAVRHRGRSTSGPRRFLSHTGHSIVVNKHVGLASEQYIELATGANANSPAFRDL